MPTLKKTGTRPTPTARTPEEQRKHRAEQAARAILSGTGNREANWERIARFLADCPKRSTFAGLDIPEDIIARVWPDPPPAEAPVPTEPTEPTVEEIGTLVHDPILGDVLEIEMSPEDIKPTES